MKRRVIAIVLAVMMAVGAFTGCGSTPDVSSGSKTESSNAESENQNAASEETQQTEEDPIIITWYMLRPAEREEQLEEVEDKLNETIYPATGAKLEIHFLDSGQFDDKMNMMISTGEEFDICFTCCWANDFITNAKRGAFYDLTEILPKYGADILAKSDQRIWPAVTVNGGIYGIPGQAPYASSNSYVFKKDLVEKYKFDYLNITALEELEPYLQTIKENEPGITPIAVGKYGFDRFYTNETVDTDVSFICFDTAKEEFHVTLDDENMIAYWKLMHDWYQKGYIKPDCLVVDLGSEEFKTGKYAVMPDAGAYDETGEKSSTAYGIDCVETYIGTTAMTNGSITSAMNAISATSAHPEKALEVLNLIWSEPELSNTMAYGIEGVNYEIDSERTTEESKSVIPKSGDESTWQVWHNWIGPLWDQWDSSWNRKDALELMQETNANAPISATLGFYFDSKDFQNEVAAISSAAGEIQPVLNTGSAPEIDTYLEEAREKLKGCGIYEVCEAMNKQYKEWKGQE